MTSDDILIRIEGKAGRITLNRPEALNALSYDMVLAIGEALKAWETDPAVALVIIDGAGDRAFCAGGDIEDMYQAGLKRDFSYGEKFWRDEYEVNAAIAAYPKPYVSIMHGFVMGGGVGVSAHGSHRIVTDGSMVAMPECGIGLVPDVGGTHLLGRAPGHLGEFAGLTGHRMGPGDAIHMDFADVYVSAESLPQALARLVETGDINTLTEYSSEPPSGELAGLQSNIDQVFAQPTMADIFAMLEKSDAAWAERGLKALHKASPLSLMCALELVRGARGRNNLVASLTHELRVTSRSAEHGEFLEGIRAAVIDKDRKPKWRYPTLDAVPSDLVQHMLAPLGDE